MESIKNKISFILVGALVFFFGCKNKYAQTVEDAPLISIFIKDELSETLKFADYPKKFVAFSPAAAELFYTLGAEQKLVGVSELCDSPPEVRKKTEVKVTKGFYNDGLPVLLELNPECVIASDDVFSTPQELRSALKAHNIPVYMQSHTTLAGVYQGIKSLGELMERKKEAEILTNHLEEFRKRVNDSTQNQIRYKVTLIAAYEPLVVVGGRHYINELIRSAGGKNVCEGINETLFEISADSLAKTDPEFIFFISDEDNFAGRTFSKYPVLFNTEAAIKKQAFNVEPANCFRPGARLLDVLTDFTRALHPSVKIDEIQSSVFEVKEVK